jgi:hypothetical protein
MTRRTLVSPAIEVSSLAEAIELYFERGWTDGLPVVPPEEERVLEFLQAGGREPDEILGVLPARRRVLTAEKVAINAVMAGCLPEYMPVVNAAVEAMTDPSYNLHGCTASTAGAANLIIVHGPISRRLGVNHRQSILGSVGFRSNATIGRAITLILRNVCGTIPGVIDMATFGHPGKFTYCIAEDEQVEGWTPLHVERGFRVQESAVTVYSGEAPHYIENEEAREPEGILKTIARGMADPANQWPGGFLGADQGAERPRNAYNWCVVISPQHRSYLLAAGWSKGQMREFLWEHARFTRQELWRIGRSEKPRDEVEANETFVAAQSPDDILLLTGGGDAGGFSVVVPPWAAQVQVAVTRRVRTKGE